MRPGGTSQKQVSGADVCIACALIRSVAVGIGGKSRERVGDGF